MNDFRESEMKAVEARLRQAVGALVVRHRSNGDVLTWRLLHAIEEEAFKEIQTAGDLDALHVRMFQSPPLFRYPRTDEPVDFGDSNALPMAFSMIYQAYRQAH